VSRRINAKRFSAVMRDMAKVPSRAAAAIARDIRQEILRSMNASVDPDGKAWRLKSDGKRSTLEKTGAGKRSILVTPTTGAGFKITVGLLRMIYHQFGGASHLRGPRGSYRKRHMHPDFGRDADRGGRRMRPPKRSFLPFDKLPRAWGEIVLARIEELSARVLRGK